MNIISGFWKTFLPLAVLTISGCVVAVDEPPRRVVAVEPERYGPPPWAPAYGWRRQHETYYYYPAVQVYYYPAARKYYWIEGGRWKIDGRLPTRYVIEEHKRVVLNLDDKPYRHHHRVRAQYPPDYFERGRRRG